ncbi:MAG: hypothetical protein JXA25_13280 [Anaerolineales bacterium]|nr:hypothetical protein [Anaerolineales bacterium]
MSEMPVREGPVLVLGSSGIDIIGRPDKELAPGSSSPGSLRFASGGVARNVAENLARLGMETVLITAVGDDPEGRNLLEKTAASGVDISHALIDPDVKTGAYLAVLDHKGALYIAIDSMSAASAIQPSYLQKFHNLFKKSSAVFLDANLSPRTLQSAVKLARRYNTPIAADPTSTVLAPRIKPLLADLWLITPNAVEAETLCPLAGPDELPSKTIASAKALVSAGVEIAIITLAESGLGYATVAQSGHVPAVYTEILDPTGASDALTAAVLFSLLNGIPVDEAARLGAAAASLTLRTTGSVVPDLSLELLYDQLL